MALHREPRHNAPPRRHPHRWVSSPPIASALDLISRQHRSVAGHALQPPPAHSLTPSGGAAWDWEDVTFPFMPGCCSEHDRLRPQPYFSSIHGSVYYTPRSQAERRQRSQSSSFPSPLIQPRPRRPHSIHIISYPPGFIPHDLRTDSASRKRRGGRDGLGREGKGSKDKRKEKKEREKAERERQEKAEKRRSIRSLPPGGEKVSRALGKLLSAFSVSPKSSPTPSAAPTPRVQSRPSSFISFARRLSRLENSFLEEDIVLQSPDMAAAAVPHPLQRGGAIQVSNRNSSIVSMRSDKQIAASSVSEVSKPVASGSGLACSILLAEPNIFLNGFDHDNNARIDSRTSSALLRGKLQLNVSKNVKIKSVTLKLVGKARTEWPEGIPPDKTELYEEQTLRTQSLVFFNAMYDIWETEYGNQCTFSHKAPNTGHHNIIQSFYPSHGGTSLHRAGLTAKELKRLSLQSVNSRSFGKGESPLAHQMQAKGYKVFAPGTYEYAFELPIDHSQLETTKLQYGSVRWDLETLVERAGAFKPNLHGSKEVTIVRLPDQMSLEMSEPISISRSWEDQLHYDIMVSGKSFPIGAKIPIAFKLTPLAKVQVHKLKVFVTESIEYWTNNRQVTRKDSGRKVLLIEKTAGKPLERQWEGSEVRVLSGGELSPEQREEARRAAAHRRMLEAQRTNGVPVPLPDRTENLLGDLDLGLESFWGSTEIEMNVQLPTCKMMAQDKSLRLHPDCSWKNVNVFHWIKVVMRISRLDPEDPAGKRRRHFEISIDSPFTILNCRASQANTSLPQYSNSDGSMGERHMMRCGCSDAESVDPNLANSAGHLSLIEEDATPETGRLRIDTPSVGMPSLPRAAHFQVSSTGSSPRTSTASNRERSNALPSPVERERPIHLIRCPSFNPPPFDADEPPPPLPTDLLSPPPNYDLIVGTPSVDGMADYFARLAAYENLTRRISRTTSEQGVGEADCPTPVAPGPPSARTVGSICGDPFAQAFNAHHTEEDSDSADDDPARPHQSGRVNVANPRTPGGRLVPSRSLEIERPVVRLDMAGVVRRNA